MPKKKLISETQLLILLNQKVDKVEGKDLSTHDFDDAARDLLHTLSNELNNKVDKVDGKGLSTCDFSNAYKNKLDGIENGAQENVIEEIRVFNIPLTITGKAVNLDLSAYYYSKTETDQLLNGKEDKANKVTSIDANSTDTEYPSAKATHDAIKQALSNVYKFQGTMTVSQLNALVKDVSMHGFVYNVANNGNLTVLIGGSVALVPVSSGDNVALVYTDENNINWDKLAGTFTVDLSNYYTKAEANAEFGRLRNSNEWTGRNEFKHIVEFAGDVVFLGNSKLYLRSGNTVLNGGTELVKASSSHYNLPYSNNVETYYTLATTNMLSGFAILNNLFRIYVPGRNYYVGDIIYNGGGFYRCINDIQDAPTDMDYDDDWEYLGSLQDFVMDHEERITALEEASPSGNTPPIDVKIVEMKIIQDDVMYNPDAPSARCNYDYIHDEYNDERNDPEFAYLHIKSSFIDDYAEQAIRNGQFLIRFDYPTHYYAYSRKMKGGGRYSFVKNFYMMENGSLLEKAYDIEKSFIYIETRDIKTDDHGNKFIYKKIRITDLLNALWSWSNDVRASHHYFDWEAGELDRVRVGGAVQTHYDTFDGGGFPTMRRDSGSVKYAMTSFSELLLHGSNMNPCYQSPNKNAFLLHYWAPFTYPSGEQFYTEFTRMKYANGQRREGNAMNNRWEKYFWEAVVKPRFAIIENDYFNVTGNNSMWIKKYSQYNKRLYCYPGQVFHEFLSYLDVDYDVAIFRFGISK